MVGISRTKAAFVFSVARLFGESEKVYFWTFTFVTTPINDDYGMEDFNTFMKRIAWHFPRMRGLRVVELHKRHGIHFHVLINIRIPMRVMKRIARGTGNIVGVNRYLDFGKMWVEECDEEIANYLSKYLSKQYRDKYQFEHRRRWGTIGGFRQTKCADIVIVNEALRNRRRIYGYAQCGFKEILMIQHYTNLWGHVDKWPRECLALVRRQNINWLKERYNIEPF